MKGLISSGLLALTVALTGCEAIERLNDDDPKLPGTRVELFSDDDLGRAAVWKSDFRADASEFERLDPTRRDRNPCCLSSLAR